MPPHKLTIVIGNSFIMAADLYINKSVLTHVNKPTRSHNTKSRSYFDVSARQTPNATLRGPPSLGAELGAP